MSHEITQQVEEAGRLLDESVWTDRLARVGLLAYGAVHLLLAWVVFQVAFGGSGRQASNAGAFAELASQPMGGVLLGVLVAGLVLLVVWQVLEAAFGHRDEEGVGRWARRGLSSAKAVLYAGVAFTAFRTLLGARSSGGGRSVTATVMGWPAGQWLVVGAGLVVLGVAVAIAYQGWSEKFLEHLDAEGRRGHSGRAYAWFGKIGHLAKGLAYVVLGALVVQAGWRHDGSEDKGLDDALSTLLEQPYGRWLLAVVALGFACYGLFCFARARHHDD